MKKKQQYKYKYNTYQKNAVALLVVMLIATALAGYAGFVNSAKNAKLLEDSPIPEISVEEDKDFRDVNDALDNLLNQDSPMTYKDRKYAKYSNEYQKYLDNKEDAKKERSRRLRNAMEERVARENAKKQRELAQKELLKQQRQMEEEQRRYEREQEAARKETEKRQLEEQKRQAAEQEKLRKQNESAQVNNNQKVYELTEEQKNQEKQRRDAERAKRLEQIKQENKVQYTERQLEEIEKCKQRAERRQTQLDRRRNAPVKSKHKSLYENMPPRNNPPQSLCEECD